jgi:hypothetical protein
MVKCGRDDGSRRLRTGDDDEDGVDAGVDDEDDDGDDDDGVDDAGVDDEDEDE